MTIYDLKPKFQALLRPIVNHLAHKGITPNQITYLALWLSIMIGVLLIWQGVEGWVLLLVPVGLFIRMALNAMDGMLAKEHEMRSDKGAILNEIGDILSDVALYLPFALMNEWGVLFMILAIITEFAGVVGWAVRGERRFDGPLGKSDRAFVMGLVSLLLFMGWFPLEWLSGLFILLTVLSLFTVLNRIQKVLS